MYLHAPTNCFDTKPKQQNMCRQSKESVRGSSVNDYIKSLRSQTMLFSAMQGKAATLDDAYTLDLRLFSCLSYLCLVWLFSSEHARFNIRGCQLISIFSTCYTYFSCSVLANWLHWLTFTSIAASYLKR
jgi:hypothetical protein